MILGTSIQAFERSAIAEKTLQAYLDTVHQLVEPAALTLCVGRRHNGLVALMKAHRRPTAAVVTAWNPASHRTPRRLNEAAQARLIAALDARGLPHFRSWGHDGSGEDGKDRWPAEDSRVVLGLELDDAARLGRRFGQNAIVWSGLDGLPLLVALR